MARIFCEAVEQSVSKTGNPFLKVSCTGEDKVSRQFYVWENIDEFVNMFAAGTRIFDCMFGGDANFPKISSFEPSDGDPTEFYTFIYPNDDHASRIVDSLLATITDPFYKQLTDVIFAMPGPYGFETIRDAFCVIPAAKAYHHDFRYGLVRHTHEVMSFVSRICDAELLNQNLDKQTALTGAFLHDVGKCFEYSFDMINRADYGANLSVNQIYLGSHLYKGAELVALAFDKMCANNPALYTQLNVTKVEHLKHIILSHHLQREWAAVSKTPQTLEAYLVFLADYYSAALGKFESIDWSGLSTENLIGCTSKYDSFFGFTPLVRSLE